MTAQPCPSCGVAVTTGYTRCPRCHAVLPGVEPVHHPSGPPPGAGLGGGTSAEPVPGLPGGGGVAWWLGGLVVVGAGVALVATQCRGGAGGGAAEPPKAAPVEAPADTPSGPAPAGPVTPRRAAVAPGPDPVQLVDALERTLAAERLYASIERDDDSLELRSSSCDDPGLVAVVDRFAAELRAIGVRTVRCVEVHGAPVFTRGL